MIYYAVFDTNVLISSLLTKKTDTATAKVIDAVAEQRIIPLYSEEIFEEYEEVLNRPKFPFSRERIEHVLRMIKHFPVSTLYQSQIFSYIRFAKWHSCQ